MFSEFRVKLQRDFFEGKKYSYEEYIKIGIDHLDTMAQSFENDMFACIAGESTRQIIIEDDWFPELKIDVFISHLWVNDDEYLAFVGWLYDTFGLNCMLDSYIWDNVERLFDRYNRMYSCRRKGSNGSEVFDYGSGIRVSNHIISMLYMSAIKIMDKAEVFMSFNTDNEEYIFEEKTISRRYLPWVYTEAVMANNMKRKQLSEYRDKSWGKIVNDNEKNEVNECISGYELEQWEMKYENEDRYPLDGLYQQLGII